MESVTQLFLSQWYVKLSIYMACRSDSHEQYLATLWSNLEVNRSTDGFPNFSQMATNISSYNVHSVRSHWKSLRLRLPLVVEQIIAYVRRIVQIMIQATDLAQILYRGLSSRKKRGPRKISIWPPFSKMAATGYPETHIFCLKRAADGWER